MQRTNTILLTPTEMQRRELHALAEASTRLWNIANYQRRQAFLRYGRIPSYVQQCREFRETETFKALGTCKAQALLAKLNEAWSSFFGLLRLKREGRLPPYIRKVRPPGYWKENGRRVVKGFFVRNDGWCMDEEAVTLARDVKVPYTCGELWLGERGRLEVLYDRLRRKWYAHIPVKVKWPSSRTDAKKKNGKASLDLGICNLAALHIDNQQPVIYSGRAVLSDWVYHRKNIAARQSFLPQGRHTSYQISTSYRRRGRRFEHAVNSMVRHIFMRLEDADVGRLYIGDLKGIRQDADHGTNGNQKLHNFWSFHQITQRIHEVAEEYGIHVIEVSERDTSKTCCLCGKQHNGRIKRGLIVCSDKHRSINADVNGAVNLLQVAAKRFPRAVAETSGSRLLAEPLLLKWNHQTWS